MPRSRSLADLIGDGPRSDRPGVTQGQTPNAPALQDSREQGGPISQNLKNRAIDAIDEQFGGNLAKGREVIDKSIDKAVSKSVKAVKSIFSPSPTAVSGGLGPIGGAAPAAASAAPGVVSGTLAPAAVAGAAAGGAAAAGAGAAGAAAGGAAAAGAAGGAAAAGSAAAIVLACHATAEYYPWGSDNWLTARQWLMEDWKGPIARRFQSWYSKHSVGWAYFIRNHSMVKVVCRPFFLWALRKGQER